MVENIPRLLRVPPAKGFNLRADFFQRSSENAKPRDISDRLDELGFIAIKTSKRVIDEDCLNKANM